MSCPNLRWNELRYGSASLTDGAQWLLYCAVDKNKKQRTCAKFKIRNDDKLTIAPIYSYKSSTGDIHGHDAYFLFTLYIPHATILLTLLSKMLHSKWLGTATNMNSFFEQYKLKDQYHVFIPIYDCAHWPSFLFCEWYSVLFVYGTDMYSIPNNHQAQTLLCTPSTKLCHTSSHTNTLRNILPLPVSALSCLQLE